MQASDEEEEAETEASTAELSLSDILGVLNKPEKQVCSPEVALALPSQLKLAPLTLLKFAGCYHSRGQSPLLAEKFAHTQYPQVLAFATPACASIRMRGFGL